MKRISHSISKFIVLLGLLSLFVFPYVISAAEEVAVVIKIKGDIELRSFDAESFKSVYRGKVLFENDIIRTGYDGSLVMVYLHDKSMYKVKPNMEMEIRDYGERGAILKKIVLSAGMKKAEINNKRRDNFMIPMPTSVASVKG